MKKLGQDFPKELRRTFLYELEEEWYLPLLAKHKGIEVQPVKRSNFGEYNMAVNYLTSVLEESAAVNTVAVYNIDHMAQILFSGADAEALLDRTLPANIKDMRVGGCKYTLLLNDDGGVIDDMIMMKVSPNDFILVINAGHDITDEIERDGEKISLVADIDRIMRHKKEGEDVIAKDLSDELVKVDVQGPLSYKIIKEVYGEEVIKNRRNPKKNMSFFTFNEIDRDGHTYYFSRTGYTNRWGWEIYIPKARATEDFKKIVSRALELGGLLVGLGGRDENRISAGAFGLPLMGSEYDEVHDPINSPLYPAAVDITKDEFIGKAALMKVLEKDVTKRLNILISEGIAVGRGAYLDGKRVGTVTSSINSPNVSLEQRLAIGSKRKNVNDENGNAAIGFVWLYDNLFETDEEGKDITTKDDKPIRIALELFREDKDGNPSGRPVLGYITQEGINEATAHKALRHIENL
ncbi:MAG TPA: aminomethyl transferase family protein [Candidatus Cloacimonetes bacterium]|nr:aminomethyl transferase family protein [Candidatus Cloacimonadota bacterium]